MEGDVTNGVCGLHFTVTWHEYRPHWLTWFLNRRARIKVLDSPGGS